MTDASNMNGEEIPYYGPPTMTSTGCDVMAFHLHRYSHAWLQKYRRKVVLITVGFEGSMVECVTFAVGVGQTDVVRVEWSFDDLCHAFRYGDSRFGVVNHGQGGQTTMLCALPVYDRSTRATSRDHDDSRAESTILAFAVAMESRRIYGAALRELEHLVGEAIRAARRNTLRLYFDEQKTLPTKSFLYGLMAHIPEWTGCDHSVQLVLTNSLEAMMLEQNEQARFSIIAERMFSDKTSDAPERLVGMSLNLMSHTTTMLAAAIAHQRQDPELPFQLFYRDDSNPEKWYSLHHPERSYDHIHASQKRSPEEMIAWVPLMVLEGEETVLLGFMCIMFGARARLPDSMDELLTELREQLGAFLRYSTLYSLSARNLWMLSQTQRLVHNAVAQSCTRDHRLKGLIQNLSELIHEHVDIPSFGIGFVHSDARGRILTYVEPVGWNTHEYQHLELDVEPDNRVTSGVSGLAARLGCPVVLAGGHSEGDALVFKNYLYVHEDSGKIIDARSIERHDIGDFSQGWRLLGDYYKPALKGAYATLAYPIVFCGTTYGVVTIEVDKHTDWLWWTGFGGQLFWQMMADMLAYAFYRE